MPTEIGPSRERAARDLNVALADERFGPPPEQVNNGEEREYREGGSLNYVASFSKGLPHNHLGEVMPEAYQLLLNALSSGRPDDFELIPLGLPIDLAGSFGPRTRGRAGGEGGAKLRGISRQHKARGHRQQKLENPQAGLAFALEGSDPQAISMPPAPRIDSAENASEMGELYWMALLRDVPFIDYDANDHVEAAADSLTGQFSDFRGPKTNTGKVTPATLFRGTTHGDLAGPYLSQFLLIGTSAPTLGLSGADGQIGYGSLQMSQKQSVVEPANDFLINFDEWLAVQRGADTAGRERYKRTRRFIRNLRDLGHYVHHDHVCQAFLNACAILLQLDASQVFRAGEAAAPALSRAPRDPPLLSPIGATPPSYSPSAIPPLDKSHYYLGTANQTGYATFGAPHLMSLVCEVAVQALRAVWFQKWFVHRRLRPESFGGLVHIHKSSLREYPLNAEILDSTPGSVLDRVRHRNRGRGRGNGQADSYLLPQAFSEGCPLHPSYGGGHAAVAGACATVLKAWFDESFELRHAFAPDSDGTKLVDCSGALERPLTLGGELNKLATNIAIGRSAAGVQWRSDCAEALKLGEEVALGILKAQQRTYNEPATFTLTKFDGMRAVIGS